MMKLLKINKSSVAISVFLIIIGGLFFIGTSAYSYCIQRPGFVKWSSPDETANYYFSKLWAETGSLIAQSPIDVPEGVLVRPRSFKVVDNTLRPVSFVGLPLLYGFLARLSSVDILPYLTPFFAVLGLLAFFGIVRRLFNLPTAIIGTTLAAFFPVYWYFTAKSMFHNVLFAACGLIACYCGLRALDRLRLARHQSVSYFPALIWLAVSGLAFGWAIATRTSELLWLIPIALILVIAYFKEIGWYRWLWWASWSWIGMLPAVYWNIILYDHWYGGGYPTMSQSIATISQTSLSLFNFHNLADKFTVLWQTIFHFGFWPKQSLTMFQHYVIEMFPWLMPLALIGILVFIFHRRQWKKDKWLYLFLWILASVFLVLYYGSWTFNDNPDASHFTIGNSYTRYWLPLYLGALPWAAEGLWQLANFLFQRRLVKPIVTLAVIGISCWSLHFTAVGSEEGLKFTAERQVADYHLWSEVLSRTEDDSIIITLYQDKLFFPERQVLVGLFDNNVMNRYYGNLLKKWPVYYFSFRFSDDALEYLNNRRLPPFGYKLEKIWDYNEFALYRLQPIPELPLNVSPQQ
ncbi:glycosyltransferase family 39 protein [Patescibacteria group bacterium]|jgi:hypothetical protein|nr:glycosyltransferase family 39 protein [Patescibacteria group bacterium]